MPKKVLAIYYSQSGQLSDIIHRFLIPFQKAELDVDIVRVHPKPNFEFPWSSKRFFDAMPESVLEIPTELESFSFKFNQYDLIILGYQPWFLSPSIPTTSILKNSNFIKVAQNTPIVTVIGARNMWLNSQEKIKKLLNTANAKLVGNVVLMDHANNLASAISIVYWMFSGKKERFMRIFPLPGVSEADIQQSNKWGEEVKQALLTEDFHKLQENLIQKKALTVKPNLMFIEERAGRLFSIWANFIIKKTNRSFWLMIFKYYLAIALFIISPVLLLLNMVFFRPFSGKKVKRKKIYYLGVD